MTQPPPSAYLHRDAAQPVPVTGNCALGRSVANDVVLVDDRVSRRHATIHSQGEREFWLVDLGSRNGTYLNGRRVSQPTRLHDGDRIQIASFSLMFRLDAGDWTQSSGGSPTEATQVHLRNDECWLLLCDITGSTALAREKAPEELAVLIGGWFARCKEVIEDNGGAINKYLGDGFLAYWLTRPETLVHVVQALRDLHRLQEDPRPSFRVVIHHGRVLFGGIPSSGEESLAGPEVNFVFRQEKIAGQLGLPRLASAAAVRHLGSLLPLTPAGEHEVPGYDGRHAFHTF